MGVSGQSCVPDFGRVDIRSKIRTLFALDALTNVDMLVMRDLVQEVEGPDSMDSSRRIFCNTASVVHSLKALVVR